MKEDYFVIKYKNKLHYFNAKKINNSHIVISENKKQFLNIGALFGKKLLIDFKKFNGFIQKNKKMIEITSIIKKGNKYMMKDSSIDIIKLVKSPLYTSINKHLIDKSVVDTITDTKTLNKEIKKLDKAFIETGSRQKNKEFYCSMSNIKLQNIGDKLTVKDFMKLSKSNSKKAVKIILNVPYFSLSLNEKQILLPRNILLELISIEDNKYTVVAKAKKQEQFKVVKDSSIKADLYDIEGSTLSGVNMTLTVLSTKKHKGGSPSFQLLRERFKLGAEPLSNQSVSPLRPSVTQSNQAVVPPRSSQAAPSSPSRSNQSVSPSRPSVTPSSPSRSNQAVVQPLRPSLTSSVTSSVEPVRPVQTFFAKLKLKNATSKLDLSKKFLNSYNSTKNEAKYIIEKLETLQEIEPVIDITSLKNTVLLETYVKQLNQQEKQYFLRVVNDKNELDKLCIFFAKHFAVCLNYFIINKEDNYISVIKEYIDKYEKLYQPYIEKLKVFDSELTNTLTKINNHMLMFFKTLLKIKELIINKTVYSLVIKLIQTLKATLLLIKSDYYYLLHLILDKSILDSVIEDIKSIETEIFNKFFIDKTIILITNIDLLKFQETNEAITPEIRAKILQVLKESIIKSNSNENCDCRENIKFILNLATITRIEKISNQELDQKYNQKKTEFEANKRAHPTQDVIDQPYISKNFPLSQAINEEINEMFLLHGTKDIIAETIAYNGFNIHFSGLGGFYGKGIYFASSLCKSYQYTGIRQTSNDFYFIISKVLMGNVWQIEGDKIYEYKSILPPNTSNPANPYNSIFSKNSAHTSIAKKHNEYIAYNNDQIYPEYMVVLNIPAPVYNGGKNPQSLQPFLKHVEPVESLKSLLEPTTSQSQSSSQSPSLNYNTELDKLELYIKKNEKDTEDFVQTVIKYIEIEIS